MDLKSERAKEMLSYLPRYYDESKVMLSILEAEGKEFDKIHEAFEGVFDQLFIKTATWGLSIWEEELGLSVSPNKSIEDRREKVMSRVRGYGTATPKLIKSVAESYKKGKIDVIQSFSDYTIIIRFVDTLGIPSNLDDMKEVLRAIIPAHLKVRFEYRYFTYDDLDEKKWAYEDLDDKDITYDELEVYE